MQVTVCSSAAAAPQLRLQSSLRQTDVLQEGKNRVASLFCIYIVAEDEATEFIQLLEQQILRFCHLSRGWQLLRV